MNHTRLHLMKDKWLSSHVRWGIFAVIALVCALVFAGSVSAVAALTGQPASSQAAAEEPVVEPPVILTGNPGFDELGYFVNGTADFSQFIEASGTRPMTFEITSGALPKGLELDPDTGEIHGMSTETGFFTFTITVTNTAGSDSREYTVESRVLPVLTETTLPPAYLGVEYAAQVQASGSLPLTYELRRDELPPGLTLDSDTGMVTGVPTQLGNYEFSIGVFNNLGGYVGRVTLDVVYEPPTITTETLATGKQFQPYTQTIETTGAKPIFVDLLYGTIPPGLKIDGDAGVLSGTPSVPGTFRFTMHADGPGGRDTQDYVVVIAEADTPPDLWDIDWDAGIGDEAVTTLLGTGSKPITMEVTAGTLPPGITMDSNGVFSGTYTTLGTYTFTVTATNPFGQDAEEFTVTVWEPPTFVTESLPVAYVGHDYNVPLETTGTRPQYFQVDEGDLPDGLTLDPDTGVISGVPTTPGTWTFDMWVDNAAGDDLRTYSIQVVEPSLAITTESLPRGVVGDAYDQKIEATGTDPIVFDLAAGQLPDGLALDSDTGAITGTPTKLSAQNFTVSATDASGTVTKDYRLEVLTRPSLPDQVLPDGEVGKKYRHTIEATGSAPLAVEVSAGDLPDGLSFDPSSRALTGTPREAGTFELTVAASNAVGAASRQVELTVAPAAEPTPTPEPSVSASASPTPEPTASPSAGPSVSPTPEPSASATPGPSASPSPEPSATATPAPSATPVPEPTTSPSASPSPESSVSASASPAPVPEPDVSATPQPGPTDGPSTLPMTGADVARLSAVVGLVLATGFALVMVGRRRRRD